MATFISKYGNLKLTIKPTKTILVDNQIVVEYGSFVQFTNGSYHTSNKDEINFLRNHPQKNEQFYEMKENNNKEKKTISEEKEIKVATS